MRKATRSALASLTSVPQDKEGGPGDEHHQRREQERSPGQGGAPYKHLGMWVFDDPRVGLNQEPFVAGADAMIDRVVADLPDAERGFRLIFAATPFPGHQYQLDWIRADEDGGNWYRSGDLDMEGWLCPALLRYFEEAPKHLYTQVKALG